MKFYNSTGMKFIMAVMLGIVFPAIAFCQDTLKTTTEYFNAGANKYINKDNTEALRLVQKGLAIDSTDEKLKKLAELILKKDSSQNNPKPKPQPNEDQSQNQDKDQNNNQNNNQDENKDQNKNQLNQSSAARMLEALNNKDKELQEKLMKAKLKEEESQKANIDKDW